MQNGYVRKSVSISKKQDRWLREHHKSLSAIVRAAINKEIDECGENDRTKTTNISTHTRRT